MTRIETFEFKRKKLNVYILNNEPMFSLADLTKVLKCKAHIVTKFISEENTFVGEFGSMNTTLRVFNLIGVKEVLYNLVELEDINEFVEWFATTIIPFYKRYAVDTGNIGLLKNIKNNENEIEFIKQGIVKDTGDVITFLKKGEQYFFKAHEVTDYLRGLKTLPRTFNLANGYKQVVESERFDFKTEADIRKVVWLTMMGIDQILLYNPNRDSEMCAWLNTLNNFVEEDYKYTFSYIPPVDEVVEMETITIDEIDFSSKSEVVEETSIVVNETQVIEERNVLGKDFKIYGTFDEPLFLAKDVAEWIEYSKDSSGNYRLYALVNTIDDDEKQKIITPNNNGVLVEQWFLTEDGLYEVLMQSRKKIAKSFKKEVKKILKEIRKTGKYETQPVKQEPQFKLPTTYKEALLQLVEQVEENEKLHVEVAQKEEVINVMKPKVTYYDLIMSNSNLLTSGQIAEDYGMSARKFNELLNELRIHYKNGRKWYLYKEHKDKGYTNSYTFPVYNRKSEYQFHDTQTGWTQSGRKFIYDTLKKFDIIPLIEKNSNLDLVSA